MKILILGGFLGSGKTTALLSIVRSYLSLFPQASAAVIENEIGETPVDDKMLEGNGLKVRNLFSGCICCTLSGEIGYTVRKVKEELDPDLLIIESSGVGYPCSIREILEKNVDDPMRICCVADAKRWERLRRAMETVLRDQFTGADVILLNKCDLTDAETLGVVKKEVQEFARGAEVFTVCAKDGLEEDMVRRILET